VSTEQHDSRLRYLSDAGGLLAQGRYLGAKMDGISSAPHAK
jgi:hypothetical protein